MVICSDQWLVLRWLSEGRTVLEIAEIDGLSYVAVLARIEAIFTSLGVATVDEALAVARGTSVVKRFCIRPIAGPLQCNDGCWMSTSGIIPNAL